MSHLSELSWLKIWHMFRVILDVFFNLRNSYWPLSESSFFGWDLKGVKHNCIRFEFDWIFIDSWNIFLEIILMQLFESHKFSFFILME